MKGTEIEGRLAAVRRRIETMDKTMFADAERFAGALDEILKLKVEEEALLIVKKVVFDMYSRIVERTPVDTGRAAASWQAGIGYEPEGKVPEGYYRGKIQAVLAENIGKISEADAGVWFIANHLEYIEALEAGWSKQAPSGMISLTLREMTRYFRENMPL